MVPINCWNKRFENFRWILPLGKPSIFPITQTRPVCVRRDGNTKVLGLLICQNGTVRSNICFFVNDSKDQPRKEDVAGSGERPPGQPKNLSLLRSLLPAGHNHWNQNQNNHNLKFRQLPPP
ncbi:hypothetical protein ACJJTC_014771 [Scirpophaga incertulas]